MKEGHTRDFENVRQMVKHPTDNFSKYPAVVYFPAEVSIVF